MSSTIKAGDLGRKMERAPGRVLLVDVRDRVEYEKEHIKGAISIPLTELAIRATRYFAPDREIITYCSNTGCRASVKAVKILEQRGFTGAVDYEGGLDDWKSAGCDTEGTAVSEAA